eukprot:TRINITY_DN5038_c0_g1_i10.p1 TRINITY_DN5038_c0_g1~~TRINITY_DN5038_c0_g1_i10.p1  ORF type:complete len:391 (+),score=67.93 TRINITY_DN5038_c0_g1_i10:287-1459(+)
MLCFGFKHLKIQVQRQEFSVSRHCKSSSIGIVGLPNVGKSCLFNALLGKELSKSSNYPFCTIRPTTGKATYPDSRLQTLAELIKPNKVTQVVFDFVDIAGLVEGASSGMGLGNQFLENIRTVDAIVQVIRCFSMESSIVTHVFSSIDPVRDIKVIDNELRLKDLQMLSGKRRGKKCNSLKFETKAYTAFVERVIEFLESGKSARDIGIGPNHPDFEMLSSLQLLSGKPVLFACNVDEDSAATGNHFSEAVKNYLVELGSNNRHVALSVKLESDLAMMPDGTEKEEFKTFYGIHQNRLEILLKEGFNLLNLDMFYTMGPKEVRGWSVPRGSTARECAGKIHSDFEKGFVKAEYWTIQDVVDTKGKNWKRGIKGADYVMQDGDCFEFKVKTK